jgi:hypothetical protein
MKLISEKQIEILVKEEVEKKIKSILEEKNKEKNKIKLYSLKSFLNKLVICISNEMENVIVGYAKDITFITQAQQPTLIVYDIIQKKEIIPMGIIMNYTEQKFDALNSLEPNQRIAIFFNQTSDYIVDKSATKTSDILSPDIWKIKIQQAISDWNLEQLQNSKDIISKKIKP